MKKHRERKPFSLEEQIEWIAIAFVLALTVRCFIVEAYQIPTGSMAPTLYGKHYRLTCDNCGTTFNLRLDEGIPLNLAFECPACSGKMSENASHISSRGGDRILVSKDLYLLRPPDRWHIFVFKSPEPENENMNFVKRLIGLPGERLEIRNGQVFVDGAIARKPERIQRSLWQKVYNGLHKKATADFWLTRGSWEIMDNGLLLSDPLLGTQTVEYDRPILDNYAYNGGMGQNFVGDLLVRGRARLETEAGEFSASIWADNDTWRASMRPAGGAVDVQVRLNEQAVAHGRILDGTPLEFGFAFSVVDGVARVKVNDIEAAAFDHGATTANTPLYTSACGVFFQGGGSTMLISDIEIMRDIYYRADLARSDDSLRGPFVIDIPEGHYLGLGDNSPISRDSRQWGVIPRENILGKAFFIFWPLTRIGPVY